MYRFLRWNRYNPRVSRNFDLRISYTKYQWCYFEIYQNVIGFCFNYQFQIIYPLDNFVFLFCEITFGKTTWNWVFVSETGIKSRLCLGNWEIWGEIDILGIMSICQYETVTIQKNLNLWPFASAFSAKKLSQNWFLNGIIYKMMFLRMKQVYFWRLIYKIHKHYNLITMVIIYKSD